MRLADGDRASFHPVFETAWPLLERFCVRLLGGNAADGADAAQAALMKVFARAAELDPERDALTWMLGIAANEARTLRRRAGRRREVPLDADGAAAAAAGAARPGGTSPEDAAIRRDLVAAAAAALATLDDADAETLALAIEDERGARPVARATFRKRVQRALARLRAAWKARHGAV